MYTEEEKNLITLCSIKEISYKCREILYDGMNSRVPDFEKHKSYLIKTLSCGVYNKVKSEYSDRLYREELFARLHEAGIVCVTVFSNRYPRYLANIPDAPHVLFCKGNKDLLFTRCFAVVGSRRTQPNMLKLCKKITRELSEHFTIVSGIADGADTAAVEGALESGKIISVLANGFDYFYPACNKSLIEKVAEKGLLLSEFPPDESPKSYNFPVRNRIIAGISEGTLIVSAGKKSGAGITANYAAEYDRDVFAFPYSPGVASGEGCNKLIKEGATLVETVDDVFFAFGLESKKNENNVLTETESELYNIIKEYGEAFIPDVAQKLGKQPYELIPVLSSLEIKELIVRLGGNRYSAIK